MITLNRNEPITFDDKLPLIPLREVVVFPYMEYPLIIARDASIKALEHGVNNDRLLFLTAQRNPDIEQPAKEDVHRTGIVARILQVVKLPNGLIRVLVEGIVRARIVRFLSTDPYMRVKITLVEEAGDTEAEVQARLRTVVDQFTEYIKLNQQAPDEILLSLQNMDDAQRLVDTMSAFIQQSPQVKQRLIEAPSIIEQLDELAALLATELEILEIKNQLDGEVRDRITKSQREFFLQEQMRVIKQELGELEDLPENPDGLAQQIADAKMPKEAHEKAMNELEKLQQMHPTSPEATVIRNYLEWLVEVPWRKRTRDSRDIGRVASVLDADHYGLEKPKEHILEYLSVIQLTRHLKGPILCLVGPPGVGKTSLGRSVARAMGRKFVRMSLGGVHDEAEIRGHRRTYIGSMPGRIIQAMRRAKSVNPVILLDEVDKLGRDVRGDPASALLEVLDPEQNSAFNDHYLEVDYDLSRVLFITTANTTETIPPALNDRMEILELPGYLETQKLAIAKEFLVPKQIKAHGLKKERVTFRKDALLAVIREYTREAGVRGLERHIAAVCRKLARKVVEGRSGKRMQVTRNQLSGYLGVPRYLDSEVVKQDSVGIATGLAWTQSGGDILTIEVSVLNRRGAGRLTLTGQLGEVMQESAHAALTYARSRAASLGLEPDFYKNVEIHVHMPEGAIPKDGPSAGITIATALCSALTGVPVRCDIAMTGEITLRGNVLPIGGLNEKLIAALRAGIKEVAIPLRNRKDLVDVPPEVKDGIEIIPVSTMDEVLKRTMGMTVVESRVPALLPAQSVTQPSIKPV
ncbi:MAG: endopeptidase La [Gemmatimonadetes bacterium]|nr:endopeptidase La [Gemmatimonadota bacterium]MYB62142.1 endopeptidase La [Gemmatimonadota bacterium]